MNFTNAKNIFTAPNEIVEDTRQEMMERIESLKIGFSTANGCLNIIEGKTEKINNISDHDAHFIKTRSLCMHAASNLSIDIMPDKTWSECCEMAIIELNKWGHSYFKHYEKLKGWHYDFMRRNKHKIHAILRG